MSSLARYHDIANALETASLQFPTLSSLSVAEQRAIAMVPLAEFRFGSLTIRTRPTSDAIISVARKYRKGVMLGAAKLPRPLSLTRPKDSDAQLAALEMVHA